jgi:hypothetical protein
VSSATQDKGHSKERDRRGRRDDSIRRLWRSGGPGQVSRRCVWPNGLAKLVMHVEPDQPKTPSAPAQEGEALTAIGGGGAELHEGTSRSTKRSHTRKTTHAHHTQLVVQAESEMDVQIPRGSRHDWPYGNAIKRTCPLASTCICPDIDIPLLSPHSACIETSLQLQLNRDHPSPLLPRLTWFAATALLQPQLRLGLGFSIDPHTYIHCARGTPPCRVVFGRASVFIVLTLRN